ncbi:hypothetical protein L208DRAFT_1383164 [Tricholoma matsutake]|nr:hypothetical protein L208DRAFT_1383164 [Tricholoma matsutake 945]
MLKAVHERKAHYGYCTEASRESSLIVKETFQDLATWRNKVLPPIIDWAGSHDDPFAVSADPSFKTIVKTFWDQSSQTVEPTDAVYAVASSAIRNWWSGIGKRTLANLSCTFKGELFKSSAPVIKSYVEHSLTHMNFMYCDPNTILKWPHEDHGKPLGALALSPTPVKLEGFLEKPWASQVVAYLIPVKTLMQSESWWSQHPGMSASKAFVIQVMVSWY